MVGQRSYCSRLSDYRQIGSGASLERARGGYLRVINLRVDNGMMRIL
jgi:hypothetical protein